MAKKKTSKSVKVNHDARHHSNARAVTSLIVLLLAFSILLIFYNYKDSIIETGMFQQFIMTAVVGMVFLVGLLFLVNPHYKKKKK